MRIRVRDCESAKHETIPGLFCGDPQADFWPAEKAGRKAIKSGNPARIIAFSLGKPA